MRLRVVLRGGRHHGGTVVLRMQGATLTHVRGHVGVVPLIVGVVGSHGSGIALVVHTAGVLGPAVGRRHPLLLLTPVAKPDPHHLLLQLEAVGEAGNLLS